MHAERRLQPGQHRRPFVGRNEARDMAVAGDIVAEQHDDVGIERVGALDDRLDVVQRHPGIAGMKVGDGGDLELEIGGPLRRQDIIARDAKPQRGLGEAIGGGRTAGDAEAGQRNEKNDGVKS